MKFIDSHSISDILMDQRMNQHATHMATTLFAPSTNLDSLIGSILLAINAQVEGDESQAGLSLAAWHQWLDEEGYPIDDALQLFCSELAASYGTDLMALKSEVADHLDDPHGLTVLSGIIDALPPPLADSCHQLAERSIVTAQDADAVAGGTRAAVIGGSIGGGVVVLGLVGTGVYLKRRSDNRTRLAGELKADVQGAFEKTEARIENDVNRIYRNMQRMGKEEAYRAYAEARRDPFKIEIMAKRSRSNGYDNLTLELKKDAKKMAESEVKFHVKHYSEALAKESVQFMEKEDKKLFEGFMEEFFAHYKVEILREEGYTIWPGENGAFKVLEPERRLNMTGFRVVRPEDLKTFGEYPEIDDKARQAARAKLESIFADRYNEFLVSAFDEAKTSGSAEVNRIELSFAGSYHNAREAAMTDAMKLIRSEGEQERAIRAYVRNGERAALARARAIEEDAVRNGEDIILEFE